MGNRRYLAVDLGAESGRGMLAHIADRKIDLTELHRFANTPVPLPTGLYWDTLRLFMKSARAFGRQATGRTIWMESESTPGESISA